jgi:hypothetical protein
MPSINNNAHFDYLDPPSETGLSRNAPTPDSVWPVDPPRADIFCNASMMLHPLVSPLAASPACWTGMPPVFLCLGNEALEDEIVVMARKMHEGGGIVQVIGYEGMPHCFAMIFPTSVVGTDCFERWAAFCSQVSNGTDPVTTEVMWAKAFSKPVQFNKVAMDAASTLTDAEVLNSMRKMKEHGTARETEHLGRWNEQESKPKL